MTNELADILNLPPGALGYIVKTVGKGSPADVMSIRGGTTTATIDGHEVVVGGDILLGVEGIPVGTADAVTRIRQRLNGLSRGSPFTVTVLRKGQVLELKGQVP